jgi:hypothetical protein
LNNKFIFKTSGFSVDISSKNIASVAITPGDNTLKSYEATIYYGPQKLHILSQYKQGFENVMVFSNWGILDIFAKMIYFFVNFGKELDNY